MRKISLAGVIGAAFILNAVGAFFVRMILLWKTLARNQPISIIPEAFF